jgi:hypothetical protein
MAKNKQASLPGEWFDLDGHGNLAVEPDEDDKTAEIRITWDDSDFVTCPRCESEDIDFRGQARAMYIARLRPYICRDCGHSFDEGDWLKEL